MVPRRVLRTARDEIAEVTGRRVESISGLHRNDSDGWVVTLEVLELQRVPSTMDLLATYDVTVSDEGEVLGFERRRRYHRAAVDDGRE